MRNELPTVEDIRINYEEIQERIELYTNKCNRKKSEIEVVAVSKTHPPELLVSAVNAGVKIFGENYAQELRDKHETVCYLTKLRPDWHFIGHLQANKVKYLAPFISMIHSVDSTKLAHEISEYAQKYERHIDILLQVNTSGEESKSGCEPEDAEKLVEEIINISNINLCGLMTIGSFSDKEKVVRKEFSMLKELSLKLNDKFENKLKYLSMGMSGDYHWAIQEGSTHLRIGTAIFGHRPKH